MKKLSDGLAKPGLSEKQYVGFFNAINQKVGESTKIFSTLKKSLTDIYKSNENKQALKDIEKYKKQLEELKERLSQISNKHDDCFQEHMDSFDELIELSIVKFPKKVEVATVENYVNTQSITIEDEDDNMHYERKHENKEYYQYEPNEQSLDDELIFQLLSQGKYNSQEGTINGLSMNADAKEV